MCLFWRYISQTDTSDRKRKRLQFLVTSDALFKNFFFFERIDWIWIKWKRKKKKGKKGKQPNEFTFGSTNKNWSLLIIDETYGDAWNVTFETNCLCDERDKKLKSKLDKWKTNFCKKREGGGGGEGEREAGENETQRNVDTKNT